MSNLLQNCLQRILQETKEPQDILEEASASEIATYQAYWSKVSSNSGATGNAKDARKVLAAIASKHAVDMVLKHVGAENTIDHSTFQVAAHLLSLAVQAAQDAVFSRDDLWSEAAPISAEKKMSPDRVSQDEWVIGTVAAAQGLETEREGSEATSRIHLSSPNSANADAGTSSAALPMTVLSPSTTWRAFDRISLQEHDDIEKETPRLQLFRGDKRDGPADGTTALAQDLSTVATRLNDAMSKGAFVPGTSLRVMDSQQRQKCQEAFHKSKDIAREGGVARDMALRIFTKAGLEVKAVSFEQLWSISRSVSLHSTAGNKLSCSEFCLFVHLVQSAAGGAKLPETLEHERALQLLGERKVDGDHSGASIAAAATPAQGVMGVDTARLRSAIRGTHSSAERDSGMTSSSANSQGSTRGFALPLDSITARRLEEGDSSDSDAESLASFASSAWYSSRQNSTRGASTRMALPPMPKNTLPSFSALTNPQTTPLERAAWAAEAGAGHVWLEFRLINAVLMQRRRKPLDRPFVSLFLRDPLGRLVELPRDTHPGRYHAANALIDFGNQMMRVETPLSRFPAGCRLFMEIKRWKAEKGRFSTVAWCAVDTDMMLDAGPTATRVRCGPMVLPLYKKPVDVTMQRCRRLNGRNSAMHIIVRGTNDETWCACRSLGGFPFPASVMGLAYRAEEILAGVWTLV